MSLRLGYWRASLWVSLGCLLVAPPASGGECERAVLARTFAHAEVTQNFFDSEVPAAHRVRMSKGQTKNASTNTSTKVVRTTVAAKLGQPRATATAVSEDDIALRAYEIYLREGRPDGRHLQHWDQARTELGLH